MQNPKTRKPTASRIIPFNKLKLQFIKVDAIFGVS